MSASEGSISAPVAAPPSSAPAAPAAPATAPQPSGTAPVSAPASADTGAVPPVIADAIAAPVTPGAPVPSTPPKTLEEARAIYEKQVATALEQGDAQPLEAAPNEVQPAEELAPVEEPPAPVEAKPQTEPAKLDTGSQDLDAVLTAEAIEAQYPRAPKELKAELVKREAHRGELLEKVRTIGGDPGLKLAEALNPIIWNENPTTEDVDNFFDAIVLPENAGAGKLFDLMGKHLVNTQLQDPDTGRDFGSNMLIEEFGQQPDNQSNYDLPFVESFINLHKSWGVGADGKPIDLATVDMLVRGLKEGHIEREFVESELADNAPATVAPDPEKLALQKKVEELEAGKTAEQTAKEAGEKAEAERTRETNKAIYKTQARNWISRQILNEILPLARTANWAAAEGEKGDHLTPQITHGKMVSAYINTEIMGYPDAPTPAYAEVMQMITEGTAFTPDGKPTPRFLVKVNPLRTRAKALFVGAQKDLGGVLKFTAQNSRNAKLANQNGGNKNGATTEAPPLASTAPKPADRPKTLDEQIAENRRTYEEKVAQIMAQQGQGQL